MFNKIMIYLALLGMALSALLSTVSSTTVEFNATNKSENVSLVTTSVDNDKVFQIQKSQIINQQRKTQIVL